MIEPDFSYLAKFLCLVTLKLAEMSVLKSRPSVPYGANLFEDAFT